jgi:pimeloyl-ACP methyl ester carboxylesterase
LSTKKAHPKPAASHRVASQPDVLHPAESRRKPTPPTVSGRWLLGAASVSVAAAALCGWLTLCLLFWQGSWQLLYHPTSTLLRTPANAGIPFDPVAFAATESGQPRLTGWWVPAAPGARYSRYTVLYLHGQKGNLSDAIDALAALHSIGINVLAIDYRGYGQSQFVHPSEARWREDAEWALAYLTATRHIAPGSVLLEGRALGANLALELAAAHPELAGVVLDSPLESPVQAIFNDPRAALVPARWLVGDRFDAVQPASSLRIPSLWLVNAAAANRGSDPIEEPTGYRSVAAAKTLAWLQPSAAAQPPFAAEYARWLSDLPEK